MNKPEKEVMYKLLAHTAYQAYLMGRNEVEDELPERKETAFAPNAADKLLIDKTFSGLLKKR